jgi:HSP20 family molecular chaperone IbpA
MKSANHRRCNSEVRIVSFTPSHPFHEYQNDLHNRIERCAYQFFEAEGRVHGHDIEHWLRAEAELLAPLRTKVQEIDDWIFVGAHTPDLSASELRIYAEPLRILIVGKSRRTSMVAGNGSASKEVFTSVELPFPISLSGSFAELRDGFLTIGFPKEGKQVDCAEDGRGETLASAHKHHLRADRMKALSHAAKEYATAARQHLSRASRKREQARKFLCKVRSARLPITVPPVPTWTEEEPRSPVD